MICFGLGCVAIVLLFGFLVLIGHLILRFVPSKYIIIEDFSYQNKLNYFACFITGFFNCFIAAFLSLMFGGLIIGVRELGCLVMRHI